jgi:universal stress protein A
MSIAKILCPVDYSDGSLAAMRLAADLARKEHAVLVLVHVRERPTWITGYEREIPGERLAELFAAEDRELANLMAEARKLGVTDVKALFADGSPWEQIVRLAEQDPAIGLIVMGTHGRTGIQRALGGSVAERVVRHAPCTVTVVRKPRS